MKPEDIIKSYNAEGSIKKVAALFRVSEQKVRKVLIDAGAYESDMSIQVNDLLNEYIAAYSKGEDNLRAFWEYVISIGAYEQMRQLAVYQDVILSYKKDQAKPSCNGYCEKVYTAEDAEFARIQIEHLLKSCQ